MKFWSYDPQTGVANFSFCADRKQHYKYPYTHKIWGGEQILVNTDLYCAKLMWVSAHYQCSMHRHLIKDETFIVLEGDVVLELEDKIIRMEKGDRVHVPRGSWHRFRNQNNAVFPGFPSKILEISTHHDDADVERREESCEIYQVI